MGGTAIEGSNEVNLRPSGGGEGMKASAAEPTGSRPRAIRSGTGWSNGSVGQATVVKTCWSLTSACLRERTAGGGFGLRVRFRAHTLQRRCLSGSQLLTF